MLILSMYWVDGYKFYLVPTFAPQLHHSGKMSICEAITMLKAILKPCCAQPELRGPPLSAIAIIIPVVK